MKEATLGGHQYGLMDANARTGEKTDGKEVPARTRHGIYLGNAEAPVKKMMLGIY